MLTHFYCAARVYQRHMLDHFIYYKQTKNANFTLKNYNDTNKNLYFEEILSKKGIKYLSLFRRTIFAGNKTVWCKLRDNFNKCSNTDNRGCTAAEICHPCQPDSISWCQYRRQRGARVVHPRKLCLSAKLFRGLTA